MTGVRRRQHCQPSAKTADGFVSTGVAFLDDIAHTANPGAGEQADDDAAVGLAGSNTGFYDNELLDAHYITGDGRGNENIGLTAVHHVFHSEHNRQVDLIQNLLVDEAKTALAELDAATTPAEIANAQAILTDKLDVPQRMARRDRSASADLATRKRR